MPRGGDGDHRPLSRKLRRPRRKTCRLRAIGPLRLRALTKVNRTLIELLWLTPFYLIIINSITYFAFWIDKQRARQRSWRVSEDNLLLGCSRWLPSSNFRATTPASQNEEATVQYVSSLYPWTSNRCCHRTGRVLHIKIKCRPRPGV